MKDYSWLNNEYNLKKYISNNITNLRNIINREYCKEDFYRILSNINFSNEKECFIWTGKIHTQKEIPRISLINERRTIQTELFNLFNIKIPSSHKFKRKCNNNLCFNKEHIEFIKPNMKNYNFFDNINTEEKAYWLGFIVADGSISKNLYTTRIQLQRSDNFHLKKFAKLFDCNYVEREWYDNRTRNTNYNCIATISNKYLCESLTKLGVYPNKTENYNIDVFEYISTDLIRHFIRGFFDGDGCISTNGKYYYFKFTGVPIFLNKIREIIETKVNINFANKLIKIGKVYDLKCNKQKDIIKIKNWFYNDSNIYLDRKKNKFDKVL